MLRFKNPAFAVDAADAKFSRLLCVRSLPLAARAHGTNQPATCGSSTVNTRPVPARPAPSAGVCPTLQERRSGGPSSAHRSAGVSRGPSDRAAGSEVTDAGGRVAVPTTCGRRARGAGRPPLRRQVAAAHPAQIQINIGSSRSLGLHNAPDSPRRRRRLLQLAARPAVWAGAECYWPRLGRSGRGQPERRK